jgi:hypothetical protein
MSVGAVFSQKYFYTGNMTLDKIVFFLLSSKTCGGGGETEKIHHKKLFQRNFRKLKTTLSNLKVTQNYGSFEESFP